MQCYLQSTFASACDPSKLQILQSNQALYALPCKRRPEAEAKAIKKSDTDCDLLVCDQQKCDPGIKRLLSWGIMFAAYKDCCPIAILASLSSSLP